MNGIDLKKLTTSELEKLAQDMYNHCPRVKKWHKVWVEDLKSIRSEINSREQK